MQLKYEKKYQEKIKEYVQKYAQGEQIIPKTNAKSQSSGGTKTADTRGDNLSETSLNKEEEDDNDLDDELMGEDLDMLEAEEDQEEPIPDQVEMINKKE